MNDGTLLAAVDLGSNSYRLEIGRLDHGQIRRTEYIKETVRQGNGLDESRNLTPEAMARGWDCLARFGERLAGFKQAQVRAVATQTLREARNRDEFLRARSPGAGLSHRRHLRPRGSPPDLPGRGPPAAAVRRAPAGGGHRRPLHRAHPGRAVRRQGDGKLPRGQRRLVDEVFSPRPVHRCRVRSGRGRRARPCWTKRWAPTSRDALGRGLRLVGHHRRGG